MFFSSFTQTLTRSSVAFIATLSNLANVGMESILTGLKKIRHINVVVGLLGSK